VYDCDGKVKEVYDTGFDGEPYTPVSVSEALSGSIPSVKNVIWPSIRHELHPDDGGENKRFLLPVTHPKTGATGYVDFQSATASNPTASGGCNYAGENVSVNAPISGGNWRSKPSENSRFTFRPDNVVKQMSMLRLEFRDLDVFEGVWGLTPWPDAIVDRNGSKETIETDDAPNIQAIHSLIPDNVVYAYYFKIPDEITHLYRNAGGGTACHAARFTGYTIEPGPCCSGCVEEEEEVEEVVVDYKCPELLTTGMRTLREDDAVIALPMSGFDLISVSVDSLRGETTVTTMDGTGTLPVGVSASWSSNGPDTALGPVTVAVATNTISQANVTWVSRQQRGNMVPVQMCDIGASFTSYVNPIGPKTQTLGNGVTVATSVRPGFYGMLITDAAGVPGTLTFSEPSDIVLGIHFLLLYGQNHAAKIPEGIDLVWLDERFMTWDPSTRMVRVSLPVQWGDTNPTGVRPAPSTAKFSGKNVTSLTFGGPTGTTETSNGLELDYLAVTVDKDVKFIRNTILDANGNQLCSRDQTLDGKPYFVTGTAEPCQHNAGPGSIFS